MSGCASHELCGHADVPPLVVLLGADPAVSSINGFLRNGRRWRIWLPWRNRICADACMEESPGRARAMQPRSEFPRELCSKPLCKVDLVEQEVRAQPSVSHIRLDLMSEVLACADRNVLQFIVNALWPRQSSRGGGNLCDQVRRQDGSRKRRPTSGGWTGHGPAGRAVGHRHDTLLTVPARAPCRP